MQTDRRNVIIVSLYMLKYTLENKFHQGVQMNWDLGTNWKKESRILSE